MSAQLGVGIVGCGAAAQSIHAAALASLPELFTVRHCMDPDATVVNAVAERFEAIASFELAALLDDPSVDVVVVASPGGVHADQVVAACKAGKRAILCEKPLAESVEDTERIADVSRRTGVPVVVGTMHRYDPAMRALEAAWGDLPARAHFIRSDMFVAPNAWLVDFVTEPVLPQPVTGEGGPARTTPFELLMFGGLMWGLAVHHLPLVRLALPDCSELEVVSTVPATSGYLVTLRSGTRVVQLAGLLNQFPRTQWTFELAATDARARIEYPPGYIPTQSAVAVLESSNGVVQEQRWSYANETGYRAQYRHLAAVARGEEEPLTGPDGAVEDARLMERLIAVAAKQWEQRR